MYLPELAIGAPAPEFKAEVYHNGSIGQHVSLSDYRGKWTLLFFYPLDFTFVCPTELYELADHREDFEKLNCQILGVSVDSVHSHMNWAKADEKIAKLGFPLVSDLTKDISLKYNVLHPEGMSLRGVFFIDPDGVLQSYTVNNLNVGRNAKELLRTLKALQTGELCPASWDHGKDTLGKA
ncbi:redoxin domain-containing protein [Candidatus Peregrinibacteria bacterium]|nr:redoxin domain-containing protein [Candidatus Peregrinibacteria bacterium]